MVETMSETVEFKNSKGKKLVADFYPASSEETIIMCHGFTGDRHEWGRFDKIAEAFNETGFNVLNFDFSGSGESEDEAITVEREVSDLKAAIKFMNGRGFFKIGLFGGSLGGLICLRNSENVSALVLAAPVTAREQGLEEQLLKEGFVRLEDGNFLFKFRKESEVFRRKVVADKRIIEEWESINQEELMAAVRCPVLIFHGTGDESVPVQDSENAIKYLNEDSRLYVIKGADHELKNQIDEVAELAMDFFKKHL